VELTGTVTDVAMASTGETKPSNIIALISAHRRRHIRSRLSQWVSCDGRS